MFPCNRHEALLRPPDGAAHPVPCDATTPDRRKNVQMMGPPQQVQSIFSAWRKDMASDDGSAVFRKLLARDRLDRRKAARGKIFDIASTA
jgi:hypothetical protein